MPMFPLFGGKQNRTIASLISIARSGLQSVPAPQATRKSRASIFKRDGLLAACGNAAIDEGFGGAVDLRNRDLHSRLDWIQTGLRIVPGFDRLRVETHCRAIRKIQLAQKLRSGGAVVHRRTADKTKASERNDLADA